MLKRKKMNKRAGMGEAMTWVVATIIIFVVLAIFVYAANVMGTYRSYTISSGEIKLDVRSQITTKTEIAFSKSNLASSQINDIKEWIGKAGEVWEKNE